MTLLTSHTVHTNKTTGKDFTKAEFDNGITLVDDLHEIKAWRGISFVTLNQDGKLISGKYDDLNHVQQVAEALDAYGIQV